MVTSDSTTAAATAEPPRHSQPPGDAPEPAHAGAADAPGPSCRNCGARLGGAWCAACGQKSEVPRLSLPHLLHEVPHGIFHVDRGLVPTLTATFLRPATVVFDYFAGRRIRWFNPLTLIVVCAGACSAAWALLPFSPDLYWALAPRAHGKPVFQTLLPLWFKLVGATQLAFLLLNASVLYLMWKTALYRTRAVEGAGARRWLGRYLGIFLPRENAALRADPRFRIYGEAIVAAAFVSAPSLLVTAAFAPLFALARTPAQYGVLVAAGAVLSCWPPTRLLATAPRELRIGLFESAANALVFAIGTPLGFALFVLLVDWGARANWP